MATSAALRQINQARILATLRKGSWSRVALAEELGLNRSTATVIVNALLEQGLVREIDPVPHAQGATGRPRVGIALSGPGAYFGGLELGNDTLTAVIADLTGREIARASAPTTPAAGPAHAEEGLEELLTQLLAQHPDIELEGIGLTVPGVVSDSGRLEWAPSLDWSDAALGERIRARFGVRVEVENDANAAALAEEQLRPRREGDNLLYLLLDAGIGGGLLVRRELYRGGTGHVGEVGHIQLPHPPAATPQSVEQTLGRRAVLDAFRTRFGKPLSWDEAVRAVSRGQSGVDGIRAHWQDTLGWLTATVAWTLDPDVVVFGGPVSVLLQGDTLALQRSLRRNGPAGLDSRWRLSTLPAEDTVGGAVALAMRDFFAIPALVSRTRTVEAVS